MSNKLQDDFFDIFRRSTKWAKLFLKEMIAECAFMVPDIGFEPIISGIWVRRLST